MKERIGTWGDDIPAHYIAAHGRRRQNFYSDFITIMDPEGKIEDRFLPHEFREHLTFEETHYSYAGRTHYNGQPLRANSLARVNMTEPTGLTLTDRYLIKKAEFIIPTVHNVMAIEQALNVAAKRYIHEDRVDMELERAVGRVVRAFDPCIACATH